MSRYAESNETIPLLWIGGWSVDPNFHPFGTFPDSLLGRRIYTIDLTACQSADHFVSVVTDTLADLQTEVDIAAWSMGTLLALKVQSMFPKLVRRMVLIAATPRYTRDPSSDWTFGYAPSTMRSLKRRLKLHREKALSDFHLTMLASDCSPGSTMISDPDRSQTPSHNPQWNRSFTFGKSPWSTESLIAGLEFLESMDLRRSLDEVHARALLIHGSNDLVCPVQAGRWVAERLKAATCIEIDGVGHFPHFMHDLHIRRRVEAFLS